MLPKTASPTPAQLEAMKRAAAYGYGYSSAMFAITKNPHYQEQANKLREDLQLFGCFFADNRTLKSEYFHESLRGHQRANQEAETKNI